MSLQNWDGAGWWKCDLHTHTPASDDYGKGPSQAMLKQHGPREWLLGHMRAGVFRSAPYNARPAAPGCSA